MARPSTIGPEPPNAWKKRAPISVVMELALAQAMLASRKISSPPSSTGLRPCRSESGP